MLDRDSINTFYLRIKAYPDFKEIEGKILYIRDVSDDGIKFSFTSECKPDKEVYSLPSDANDNGWYDINKSVLTANAVVLPKYTECMFKNETAKTYRDFLGIKVDPVRDDEAIGKLCFLGERKGDRIEYSKQVYYIASADENGFMITYSGFCQPLRSWERPRVQQKVLNISRSDRELFPANDIVEQCNLAFDSDSLLAEKYTRNIHDLVAATSVDGDASRSVRRVGALKELNFAEG